MTTYVYPPIFHCTELELAFKGRLTWKVADTLQQLKPVYSLALFVFIRKYPVLSYPFIKVLRGVDTSLLICLINSGVHPHLVYNSASALMNLLLCAFAICLFDKKRLSLDLHVACVIYNMYICIYTVLLCDVIIHSCPDSGGHNEYIEYTL